MRRPGAHPALGAPYAPAKVRSCRTCAHITPPGQCSLHWRDTDGKVRQIYVAPGGHAPSPAAEHVRQFFCKLTQWAEAPDHFEV